MKIILKNIYKFLLLHMAILFSYIKYNYSNFKIRLLSYKLYILYNFYYKYNLQNYLIIICFLKLFSLFYFVIKFLLKIIKKILDLRIYIYILIIIILAYYRIFIGPIYLPGEIQFMIMHNPYKFSFFLLFMTIFGFYIILKKMKYWKLISKILISILSIQIFKNRISIISPKLENDTKIELINDSWNKFISNIPYEEYELNYTKEILSDKIIKINCSSPEEFLNMFNMLLEDIQITPIIYQNSVEAVYLTETAIGTLATVAELLVTDYIMFTIPALSILIGYKLYSYFSYVKPLVEKPIVDDNLVSEVIENIVPEVIENVVPEVVMIPVPVSLIAEISRASFILTNFLNIYTEGIFRALRVGHTHPQDAEKIIEFINVVEEYTERLKDLIQILLSQVPYP